MQYIDGCHILAKALAAATSIAATADAAVLQPQNDGVAASIIDTAITGSVKARLMGDSHLKQ